MDPLFWLWLAALGLPVALWLTRPWRTTFASTPVSEEEHRLSELLARKEAIMDARAELEMDFRAGKVTPEDYQAQKAALMEQGAAVLKALEELEKRAAEAPAPATSIPLETEGAPSAEDRVEALLTARKRERRAMAVPDGDFDEIEALLQARRQAQMARYIGFCPSCGAALRAGQRFCPSCGQEVPASLRRKARQQRIIPAR